MELVGRLGPRGDMVTPSTGTTVVGVGELGD